MGLTAISKIKESLEKLSRYCGCEIFISGGRGNISIYKGFPKDMDIEFKSVYEKTKDHTLTSIENMYALYKATEYIAAAKVPGDFVECGVWKGGSAMIMANTLLKKQEAHRKIYLYDTFTGMAQPTEKDVTIADSAPAITEWEKRQKAGYNEWAFSPLEEVKANMLKTAYKQENIVFVKGKVEETIPQTVPSKIALLRLDTDWYESTYHELKYLFPLLVPGGVIIIDDYGHFAGAKEAVDTYFKENNITMLLNRIDYTARLGIKAAAGV